MNIISLTLVSVTHSGAPIGDDIRIETEGLGYFFSIHKKVPNRKTVLIGKEIAQMWVPGSSVRVPVTIRVIERDPIFNDVGTAEVSIAVPAGGREPKQSTHPITVQEWRGTLRKKAVFTIVLEAAAVLPARYLLEGKNGWTEVRPEDGKKAFSLAAHTKVTLSRRDDHREYFTVMEGGERGRKASIELKRDGSSVLGSENEHREPVNLVYSISSKTLRFGRETYQTVDYKSAPWAPGIYDVELPDSPHRGGRTYLNDAPHALTWFLIGHVGERYIHTGGRSRGCITLTEQQRWEKLYQILIRARKGDGVSIGALQVIV